MENKSWEKMCFFDFFINLALVKTNNKLDLFSG